MAPTLATFGPNVSPDNPAFNAYIMDMTMNIQARLLLPQVKNTICLVDGTKRACIIIQVGQLLIILTTIVMLPINGTTTSNSDPSIAEPLLAA